MANNEDKFSFTFINRKTNKSVYHSDSDNKNGYSYGIAVLKSVDIRNQKKLADKDYYLKISPK